MATIVPPPSTPIPAPAPVVPPTVIVDEPPPALTQLSPGSIVEAKILELTQTGTIKLQTNLGAFDIKTAIPFPKDAVLELLLLKNSPLMLLQINSVNGKVIANTGAPSNIKTSPAPIAPSLDGVTLNSRSSSVASAVGPATRPTNAPSTNPVEFDVKAQIKAIVINAGDISAGKVQSQTTASNTSSKAVSGALNQSARAAASTPANIFAQFLQTAPTQNSQPAPEARLAPGSQIDIRIYSITPQVAPQGGQQGQSSGQNHGPPPSAISGTVSAISTNGQPLVETSLGLLSMAIDRPPPIGSTVLFDVVQSALKPALHTVFQSFPDVIAQSGKWPNLDDAFSHLFQSAPSVAEEVLNTSIPRANSQLLSNVLFFLNALKGGDLNSWLGTAATNILANERLDLSNRLSEEFSQIARVFNEAPQTDWRTAIVPFFNGSTLEPVQMHMRGNSANEQNEGNEEPSRFIIDVQLSELGRVQLDGLVRSGGKRFDMIVRTEIPFIAQMKRDIGRIFSDFSEATGVAGALTFQNNVKFIDIPIPKLEEQDGKGIVI